MLRLRTLGGLAIEGDAGSPNEQVLQRRHLQLLAVLARAGERGAGREKVISYFWPEKDPDRARHSLNQALSRLRIALGNDVLLLGDGERLRLNPEIIATDAAEFETALRTGAVDRAAGVYGGEFLEDADRGATADFEEWVQLEREKLGGQYRHALRTLAGQAAAQKDWAQAVDWWATLADCDGHETDVATGYIRALVAAQRIPDALAFAQIHAQLRQTRLGLAVSAAVTDLVGTIRDGTLRPEPADAHRHPDQGPGPVPTAEPSPLSRPRLTRWPVALGVSALALAVWAASRASRTTTALDSDRYVVAPFRATPAARWLDGKQAQRLLSVALERWPDLKPVPLSEQSEANEGSAGAEPTLAALLDRSRDLHSGMLVWGGVEPFGDSLRVHAELYDVAAVRATTPASRSVVYVRTTAELQDRFAALADSLVAKKVAGTDRLPPGATDTRVIAALRKYIDGYRAREALDLARAAAEFDSATRYDTSFARAYLMEAQALAWWRDTSSVWRDPAGRAVILSRSLPPTDVLRAKGLLALAENRFEDACGAYREWLKRDTLDFDAWFGLGECQSRDDRVIRGTVDGAWRFRSSRWSAIQAYRRAFEVFPPAAELAARKRAFVRFARVLVTEPSRYRLGSAMVGTDTVLFGAYPSLESDTLAFTPRPLPDLGPAPATLEDAVARGQAIEGEIVRRWATRSPNDPAAQEALAVVLETALQPDSALTATRAARATAREPAQQMRLAVAEVRLLVKQEDFDRARVVADSTLSKPPLVQREADRVAGLAALTGRAGKTAELLRMTAVGSVFSGGSCPVKPPPQLSEPAFTLRAHAYLGGPGHVIDSIAQHVYDRVPNYYPRPEEEACVRDALLSTPMSFAFPALGDRALRLVGQSRDRYVRMLRALAGGKAAVRTHIDSLEARRRALRPGRITVDARYLEAWTLFTAGDTARAASHLDLALSDLPALGGGLVEVQQAAGLVRAMTFRAELADLRHDTPTRQHWARAVESLWRGSDPAFQPIVTRMRQLAP